MFEQAVLPARPLAGRYWAIVVAITGELLLVSFVVLAPMIWPQLLPRAQSMIRLTLSVEPSLAPKPFPIVHARPAMRPLQFRGPILIAPATVPARVPIIEDAPVPPGEFASGITGAGGPADLSHLGLGSLPQPLRLQPLSPPEAPKAVPAAEPPSTRAPIRVGSGVQMARLIKKVEPVYPAIAKQARISGTVELTGIIGADGRIRELRVLSGHPLLAKAALDAVRQWIYEATLLNGEPVEVIAPITVTFRLN